MSHTHSHDYCTFIRDFLFDRYETIEIEKKPSCSYEITCQEEVLTLSEFIGKNDLTELVSAMCRISKIEPENPYQLHRVIPSARNLSSNRIRLLVPFNNIAMLFEYDNISENFIYFGNIDNKPVNETTMLISYDHKNIGRMYGRFGYLLSLLDAGHQVDFISKMAKDICTIEYLPRLMGGYDENIIVSIKFPKHDEAYIEWIINCHLKKKESDLADIQWNDLFMDTKKYCESNSSYISFRNKIYNDNKKQIKKITSIRNEIELSLKHWGERTSFQSFQGLMFTEIDNVKLDDFIFSYHESIDGLELIVIDCCNKVVYGRKDVEFRDLDVEKILHDSHEYVALNNLGLLFLTYLKEGIEYSEKEIATAFIQSAEWLNDISMQLTKKGFITRCLRNIDDYYVISKVADCKMVTYMMMCGKNEMDSSLRSVML